MQDLYATNIPHKRKAGQVRGNRPYLDILRSA
jgi:hypothetical protein